MNIEKLWYCANKLAYFLWPLSALFFVVVQSRRFLYHTRIFKSKRFPVPVIIVGNLTVGGTGKTPMIIALARHLSDLGYSPGIVSRGYGRDAAHKLHRVMLDDPVAITGDEAQVIFRNVSAPLMLGRDRRAVVRRLIEDYACNIVLSDDGLQHYALQRDLEILMIDGQRRFGNGWLLPAGPLREPMKRAECCDFQVVVQGPAKTGEHELFIRPLHFVDINDVRNILPLEAFRDTRVHAVAGIGNPGRFFDGLRQNQIHCIEHAFNDHHRYKAADFDFSPHGPIVMTEKDAVKCADIQLDNAWYLANKPELSTAFETEFDQQLEKIASKYG